MQDQSIPLGLCQCGCGQKTTIARVTDRAVGRVKGQPVRFVKYHRTYESASVPDPVLTSGIPYGLCQCGCGKQTALSSRNRPKEGVGLGRPRLYALGHSPNRLSARGPEYVVNPETGCWEWQGARAPKGYGRVNRDGRLQQAHVLYYEQANGPVEEGKELDHLCRNPACVNPDHLEPVTSAVNSQRGVKAKLTAAEVAEMRRLMRTTTLNNQQLAARFSVSDSAVSCIRNGQTWKNVS